MRDDARNEVRMLAREVHDEEPPWL